MRIRAFVVLTALLLVPATGARAQDTAQADEPKTGTVDFGGQFTTVDGDEARYERYRDFRNAPLIDAFTYTREKNDWVFTAAASHVGYRDQRYVATFRNYDRVTINFTWDQIPTNFNFIDADRFGLLSATPYRRVGDGEYRLDDGMQAALEAVCPVPTSCPSAAASARQVLLFDLVGQQAGGFDIEHRRDTAVLDASVSLMKNTNLLLHFQNTRKEGTQPWAASFGFAHAVDLPGPVDHRTTDVGAALEYATDRAMLKVGWDGSWFTNHISTLVWDNPLRLTDFTYGSAYSPGDGTSQGREDLWPDSSMNMISGTATYRLPRRTRAYANLGYSKWDQNGTLLPHTINSAIPPVPLDRSTAEAAVDVTSALAGLTGRPTDRLWFNARYKLYDYDNNMPEFPVHEYVRFDQVVEEFVVGPGAEPFAYKRQYVDADVSYNVLPFTAVRLGYSLETDRRTFRQFEKTSDNIFKVALDTTGWQYLTLRAQYDFAKRTGEGLDEQVFDADNEGQALPRQFDISDRDRHRFTFIANVIPSSLVAVSAQVGIFRDSRPDQQFGLIDTDGDFYSIGVDVTPMQKVAFGLTYSNDSYKALQRSRQANPGVQETDPRRDWTTDIDESVDSIYAYVDVLGAIPRTDVRYALDWMDGVNDITYGLRPDQTIFTTVPLMQLPQASQRITRSMLDVMYRLSRHFGIGGGWLLEDYTVNDWGWNQETVNGLSLNRPGQAGGQQVITTRYLYRPYTGNTGIVRLRYFW